MKEKILNGFTLAEVLITLTIVGVVAAMTIPGLLTKLDKVVKSNQIKVFERKLEQGMDNMNLAGEIGPYYNTTEDFVKKLSEHMKIVTICDKDNLTNCFPYEEITLKGEDKPLKVKDIADGANFGIDKKDFKDVAGIVLADGTPMILSWNTNCPVSDPDSSSRKSSILGGETPVTATACVKGIYDLNGPKGPNLFTKDVVAYGGVNLDRGEIFKGDLAWLNGARVLTAGSYQPMLKSEICTSSANVDITYFDPYSNQEKTKSAPKADTEEAIALGIKSCSTDGSNDYWAGAVRECGGVTKMPTMAQLAQLAMALYKIQGSNNSPTIGATLQVSGLIYQDTSEAGQFLSAAGLNANNDMFILWSSEEYEGSLAFVRDYNPTYTGYYAISTNRDSNNFAAICIK